MKVHTKICKVMTSSFVTPNEAVRNQHVWLHKFWSTTCDRHRKLQHMPSTCIRMSSWQSLKVAWLILRIRRVVIGFMWRCEITWMRKDACKWEKQRTFRSERQRERIRAH